LITVVSAVEALARSLVVHAPGRPASSSHFRYQQVRLKAPLELVEEALRLYGAVPAVEQYGDHTWQLFELAHKYRNLVVHECTYLGQDKYPALIGASERSAGRTGHCWWTTPIDLSTGLSEQAGRAAAFGQTRPSLPVRPRFDAAPDGLPPKQTAHRLPMIAVNQSAQLELKLGGEIRYGSPEDRFRPEAAVWHMGTSSTVTAPAP
jgi:hypothetical protein